MAFKYNNFTEKEGEQPMRFSSLPFLFGFCLLYTSGAEESGSVAPAMRGNCGAVGSEDSVQWALADDDGDGSYTLTISGDGAMANYTANSNNEKKATQPWRASETGVEIEKITKVEMCIRDSS